MRPLILALLAAATVAAPTPSFADDRSTRPGWADGQRQSAERAGSRRPPSEADAAAAPGEPRPAPLRRRQPTDQDRADRASSRHAGVPTFNPFARRGIDSAPRPEAPDSVRDWRQAERGQLREQRVRIRPGSRPSAVIASPNVRPDLEAPAPTAHRRRDFTRPWLGSWRSDRRYDWRSHRQRHRSIFVVGHYRDPFGWSYRRWPIGWRLWPSYYQADYWLRDPWRYRLPPVYGPYRWVRYWDDALLVDLYSGEVVDVIHGFFW